MPAREIKVEIVGDASSFTKASDAVSREAGQMSSTFDRLQKDANEASRGIDKTSSSLKDAGEAGGDMESAFRGVLDVTGAVGEQFGVALPAGLQTGLQGITDIGGGIESFIRGAPGFLAAAVSMTTAIWAQVTALTAQAAAFVVANAPIIAIIAVIALVAAGVYLLIQHWDTITEKVPALGVAFEAVKAALQAFVDWITGVLVPAVMGIADKFIEGAQKIVSAIQSGFGPIQAILETYVNAWRLVIEAVWTQIQIYVETAIGVIQGVIDVAMGLITGDWDRAWDGIKQIVDAIWTGIKATVENGINLLKGLGGLALDAGKVLFEALKSGLMDIWHTKIVPFVNDLPGEIVRILGDTGMALYNAGMNFVTGLFNGIRAKFNEGIGAIKAMIDPRNWDILGGSPLLHAMDEFGTQAGTAFVEAYWDTFTEKWVPKQQAAFAQVAADMPAGQGFIWGGIGSGGATGIPDWIGGSTIPGNPGGGVGGFSWGGAGVNGSIPVGEMPPWIGGTTIAPGPAWATPSVGDWSGNGTAAVQWDGSQWIQGGMANSSGGPMGAGVNYGFGYSAANPPPQVIKLVVDGETLAQVVNTANGRQL